MSILNRETLEKYQVLLYLIGIALGLTAGVLFPDKTRLLELALWPVLGILLYVTFTQVPLAHLCAAFHRPRFLVAAVIGNFVILPIIAWALMLLGPNILAVQLGILLVLLVPCTDWFITFTHLGGGDTKSAIALAPISLILQLLFLPFYLWLFLGSEVSTSMVQRELLLAFLGLIALPLMAAFLTQKWVEKVQERKSFLEILGWFPVPLLAIVVFSISAAQVNVLVDFLRYLPRLLVIFSVFLLISGFLSVAIAKVFALPTSQGRALAFSFGSRNSFVVLPLALTLPPELELAVVVIVFQSLVELVGMAIYIWWVPNKLHPAPEQPARI